MSDENHPRVKLLSCETPIDRLSNLSRDLGVNLFIKRDDLAGAPFGGNKSRQLEYYLGAAQAEGADTILITGAVQSNFVRTAAGAARALGMKPVVQLEDRVPGMNETYHASGNVLLLRILGAEIIRFASGEDEEGADAALRSHASKLKERGCRPYVIPLSPGNPPIGALGYMRAAREIVSGPPDFDFVIVASGSGVTHAGLMAGMRDAGSNARVIGSCVRRPASDQHERLRSVLDRLAGLVPSCDWHSPNMPIELWDGALAPGYGKVGAEVITAMKMLARREGVLVDPTYTAKAFAAIPALVSDGTIASNSNVLFVHTGGLAGTFGYVEELESLL